MSITVRRLPDGGFRLEAAAILGGRPADVFPFFADPRNLERITPPWLRFRIARLPDAMRPGALIAYRLRLRGVPIRWLTEITVWEPGRRFVDVQRRGPYRRWVHEHRFEQAARGTLATDRVDYDVPGGRLTDRLLVRRELVRIFAFRRAVLTERFPLRAAAP